MKKKKNWQISFFQFTLSGPSLHNGDKHCCQGNDSNLCKRITSSLNEIPPLLLFDLAVSLFGLALGLSGFSVRFFVYRGFGFALS